MCFFLGFCNFLILGNQGEMGKGKKASPKERKQQENVSDVNLPQISLPCQNIVLLSMPSRNAATGFETVHPVSHLSFFNPLNAPDTQ